MVFFPNCKINIGLDVLARRDDGFHELATLMYPVHGLCDSLEIVRAGGSGVEFAMSGLRIDCATDNNICIKAHSLMHKEFGIGGVRMHLHKVIPFGAGLGGGSADAAFAIRAMDNLFGLGLGTEHMESLAAKLGSDTAFFIRNRPALASGRGEILESCDVNLSGLHLVILKPPFGVGTGEAYSGIKPHIPSLSLKTRLDSDITQWRETLKNDFEEHIIGLHPQIGALKSLLYNNGAIYASMSGSGSAVFGIFDQKPNTEYVPSDTFVYQCVMQ